MRHLRTISRINILFSFVGFTVAAAWADPAQAVHIRNFGTVNANLYRGGAPSSSGLAELRAYGVKWIVDLRQPGEGTLAEQREVAYLGMHYVNIPLKPLAAPTPMQVRTVLIILLSHSGEGTFVHCRRGKDRTGTVIACYRVQHDGWADERALEEAKQYGMSHLEHAMRSFVLHFSPFLPDDLAATGSGVPQAVSTQP